VRPLSHEHERFNFLGYTFRPRLSKSKDGHHFLNFSPAVGDDAKKAISKEIRSWRINRRSDKTLTDLARMFNPILHGWINYYGRFYKSMLYPTLRRLNDYLVRWAMQKYKRLHRHANRARKWLQTVARRDRGLFAHWRMGLVP
jgi:RNA-directed DNA polymerase